MKVSESQVEQIKRAFKRIFALSISRLTIRELQNALTQALSGNIEATKALYESFLTGELKASLKEGGNGEDLSNLVEEFTFPFKIAREVAEMGEFMNSFSCDFVEQGKQHLFINRLRRIDGSEYYFLSEPPTNIRLAHMFINRLRDLKKAVGDLPLDPKLKEELFNIKKDIEELLV